MQQIENIGPISGNLCDIQVVRQGNAFVAKIKFDQDRNIKEFRSSDFEGILEQLHMSLQDRFEELLWD